MKRLAFTFLLFTPFITYSQTSIIAVKSKNSVIVGADSRVSAAGINLITGERLEKYSDTCCKLIMDGRMGFAVSGFNGEACLNLAKKLMLSHRSLKDFENEYQKECPDLIAKAFIDAYKHMPALMDSTYKMGYTLCDAIIFGYENDSLFLHYICLKRAQSDRSRFDMTWFYRYDLDTLAMGEWQEIYAQNLLKDKQTWEGGTIKGITYLINFVHEKHPTHVGGPINFIMVTKRKTKWIDKKPPCAKK